MPCTQSSSCMPNLCVTNYKPPAKCLPAKAIDKRNSSRRILRTSWRPSSPCSNKENSQGERSTGTEQCLGACADVPHGGTSGATGSSQHADRRSYQVGGSDSIDRDPCQHWGVEGWCVWGRSHKEVKSILFRRAFARQWEMLMPCKAAAEDRERVYFQVYQRLY